MRQITADHWTTFQAVHEPPCISLYMPTHRVHPDNQQDPLRYRNLLKEMDTSLRMKYPLREVGPLLEKFEELADNAGFWNHRTDGLAILCSPDTFRLFELQRTVNTLLVVADSFHMKPLLRALRAADRYEIPGQNRHEAKLYEGTRDALVAGRVGTLLIEADRQIPGTVGAASRRVEFGALGHSEVDDLLDDLAE